MDRRYARNGTVQGELAGGFAGAAAVASPCRALLGSETAAVASPVASLWASEIVTVTFTVAGRRPLTLHADPLSASYHITQSGSLHFFV